MFQPFIRKRKAVTPEQRMARATLAVRRKTKLGQLEALQAERAKWARRETIARNKLAAVQRKLDALAAGIATDRFETDLANTTQP